jgi:hypothetical protein
MASRSAAICGVFRRAAADLGVNGFRDVDLGPDTCTYVRVGDVDVDSPGQQGRFVQGLKCAQRCVGEGLCLGQREEAHGSNRSWRVVAPVFSGGAARRAASLTKRAGRRAAADDAAMWCTTDRCFSNTTRLIPRRRMSPGTRLGTVAGGDGEHGCPPVVRPSMPNSSNLQVWRIPHRDARGDVPSCVQRFGCSTESSLSVAVTSSSRSAKLDPVRNTRPPVNRP